MAGNEVATTVLTREQTDTPVSFRETLQEAQSAGLTAEQVNVVINPYTTLNKDKTPLVGVPFIIRTVAFHDADSENTKPYVILWCVTEDDKLFRVTDGSTGIYAQMVRLVEKRIEEKHPTPYNYFAIANGLTVSDFGVNKEGTAVKLGDPSQVATAQTFYLG